ncbi:hypothetical protein ACQEU3_22320 [Spirillospora sp. CA-253888]
MKPLTGLALRAVLACLVGLVGIFAVVVGYFLLAAPGGPFVEESDDPRAAEGADPRLSLEQAVRDMGLRLPSGISQVRYVARNDSRPSFLRLSFGAPCSVLPGFTADNGLVRVQDPKISALDEGRLREMAHGLGKDMPEGAATIWGNKESPHKRSVAGVSVDGRDCQVVGAFEDYS